MVNRGIFGGGVFSVARGRQVRIVGGKERKLAEISIRSLTGAHRTKSGEMEYAMMPPFLPRTLREGFHHGGNSLCFAIQLAHLMGANPIYLVGFTLQSGIGYFFGRSNPVTRRTTIYQHERALAWCRWYGTMHPGRVQLDPSFSGPIYDVFPKANFDARQATAGDRPPVSEGHEPDAVSRDANRVADGPAGGKHPAKPVVIARRQEQPTPPRPRQAGRVIGG